MNLHNQIMNISCEYQGKIFKWAESEQLAYKLGHRDARHAAAELSLPYEPPAMEKQHVMDLYICLRKHNMTIPSERLGELKDFLLKFAKEGIV